MNILYSKIFMFIGSIVILYDLILNNYYTINNILIPIASWNCIFSFIILLDHLIILILKKLEKN